MTRPEFTILVKAMKSVYTSGFFIPDQNAYDVWYVALQDLPYKVAHDAVMTYIKTEKGIPTPADIRNLASSSVERIAMTEMEAWSQVRKAICNSLYHAEEEFEKFPEAVKRAVGSPSTLKEWAMSDISDVNTVVSSNFMRSYRSARMQENKESMSTDFSKLVQDLRARERYLESAT